MATWDYLDEVEGIMPVITTHFMFKREARNAAVGIPRFERLGEITPDG